MMGARAAGGKGSRARLRGSRGGAGTDGAGAGTEGMEEGRRLGIVWRGQGGVRVP